MSTKSSLCVRLAGKMERGEKESIGSPFMCSWGRMRRAHCGAWLEVASPALVQRLRGELEPFCRLCGHSGGGYLLDLAIGRYSCQSCQYI